MHSCIFKEEQRFLDSMGESKTELSDNE